MKRRMLIALSAIALLVTSSAISCEKFNRCSPGFWKNHTELWYGAVCDMDCSADLLADLKARGKGSERIRRDAQAVLNFWADRTYGYAVCEDADDDLY